MKSAHKPYSSKCTQILLLFSAPPSGSEGGDTIIKIYKIDSYKYFTFHPIWRNFSLKHTRCIIWVNCECDIGNCVCVCGSLWDSMNGYYYVDSRRLLWAAVLRQSTEYRLDYKTKIEAHDIIKIRGIFILYYEVIF